MNKLPILYDGNKEVYIVATGESLKGFDFEKLKDKNVIAVNHAFMYLPNADAVVALDGNFYKDHAYKLIKFRGIKITDRPVPYNKSDLYQLECSGMYGIDYRNGYIKTGNLSGYAAINVAIHMGALKIYLLGFDISWKKQPHFYKEINPNPDNQAYVHTIQYFEQLERELTDDIDIINVGETSLLTCFPKIGIDDLFGNDNC